MARIIQNKSLSGKTEAGIPAEKSLTRGRRFVFLFRQ
jgi:hypothetical protein